MVARFDHDILIDYRGARPALVFAEDHYQDYAPPEIVLHAVEDADGTRFLCSPAASRTSSGSGSAPR